MFTTEVDRYVPARHRTERCSGLSILYATSRLGQQSLGEYTISQTGGMMPAIYATLCRLRSANGPMTPILVDLDNHYRLLRAADRSLCADRPMRNLICHLPFLLRIWHAYEHVVVSCPSRFRPWFTALQYSSFLTEPGGTMAYYFSKVRELERIMLAVFHHAAHADLHSHARTTHGPQEPLRRCN